MQPPASTSEYDRFGPWIDEIRELDDVPPLFRDHPLDLVSSRLVLKVPRNITRRDATPDMDLYDYVLALDDEALTVLARRTDRDGRTVMAGGGVDLHLMPLPDVVAIRDTVNMLDGSLTICALGGAQVSVRYNGSARENVQRLVDALREGSAREPASQVGASLLAAGRAAGALPSALTIGQDDLAVVHETRELTRRLRSVTPWVGHGRRRLQPRATGAAGLARTLAAVLSPTTLHAGIIAGDDHALEIFGRHDWLITGRQPVHSTSRLTVPLAAVVDVQVTPHPRMAGAVVGRVDVDGHHLELVVPEGSTAHTLLSVPEALT